MLFFLLSTSLSSRDGVVVGGGGGARLLWQQRLLWSSSVEHLESEMERSESKFLYCKASRDGSEVGDCPFTHYARMAMEIGGVSYEVKPTKEKPEWLGSMPCLAASTDGADAISESSTIAARALPPTEVDEASMEATKTLFGAIAKFVKNTDPSADDELLQNLHEALACLEARLKTLGAAFLSGDDDRPGLSDCSVATKLYVLTVAGEHYKGFTLPVDQFPLVHEYIQNVERCDAFATTKYPTEEMIFGWGEARAGAH